VPSSAETTVYQGPEVPTEKTAKGLVSDVRCLGCFVLLKTGHLFGRLKQEPSGRRFHSNEEVKTDIREWLEMQRPDLHRDGKVGK
jgi:hypothetical protein